MQKSIATDGYGGCPASSRVDRTNLQQVLGGKQCSSGRTSRGRLRCRILNDGGRCRCFAPGLNLTLPLTLTITLTITINITPPLPKVRISPSCCSEMTEASVQKHNTLTLTHNPNSKSFSLTQGPDVAKLLLRDDGGLLAKNMGLEDVAL